MHIYTDDRRASQHDLPEGLIRRHDASSSIKEALVIQRELGIEKARSFLQESGVSDEVAARVLQKGLVREQDVS